MQVAPLHDPEPAGGRHQTLGDLLQAGGEGGMVEECAWFGLVQAIARGDQAALHSLYEQAHRIVFTMIMRITANRETAEEVTMDVFHDVWRRAATYDQAAGPVIAWLMNQARCRALDRLRFEQRQKRTGNPADGPLAGETECGPATLLERKEQGDLLRDAVGALRPDERQAIEAAFFGELTHREVADRLHQPLGTVKTRIRSALMKLRAALSARRKP